MEKIAIDIILKTKKENNSENEKEKIREQLERHYKAESRIWTTSLKKSSQCLKK